MTTAPVSTLLEEIASFLGGAPSLDEIIAYKIPAYFGERLEVLMDENSEGTITPEELDEFDEYLFAGHVLSMIQLKTRLKKAGKT